MTSLLAPIRPSAPTQRRGSPRNQGWEAKMREEVSTTEGRTVLIRVCPDGEGVQLAVIGKRGSMVEAIGLDSAQLPAVIAALTRAGKTAHRDLMEALSRAESEAEENYRAALARNPWMQPGREKRGLV